MKISHPQIRRSAAAFTLVELLVVITILGILMGLAAGGSSKIKDNARAAQALSECASLVTAVRNFYGDYSRYPVPQSKDKDGDALYEPLSSSDGNREVVSILTGADTKLNPRGTTYYEPKNAKFSESTKEASGGLYEGGVFDPWGRTYGMVIDADYDGKLEYKGQSLMPYFAKSGVKDGEGMRLISGGVGVFSLGKKQAKNVVSTPILSWK
ncbi:MAG: hypothetical protein RLZZ244_213 [Verrucomicrobiota bacterium]|jgi:prepilin-type N-terminal cleavage/methylation domain-containing protein